MQKFIPTLKIVNEYDWMKCDIPIDTYRVDKDGDIFVRDEEGNEQVIDADVLCDLYGDDAAGGAEMVEGGAILFETVQDRENWEKQK